MAGLCHQLEVFTRHGYERASLEQVTVAAGLSKGAVYSNYASKDALFLALMDQQVQARIAQTQAAVGMPHDHAAVGRLVGSALTQAFTDDRDWQLLFLDYMYRAPRATRRSVNNSLPTAVTSAGSSPTRSGTQSATPASDSTPTRSPPPSSPCPTASPSNASPTPAPSPTTYSAVSFMNCDPPRTRDTASADGLSR